MGVEDEGHNFLSSDWDPLLLVNQSLDFFGSNLAANQGFSSSSAAARLEQMESQNFLSSFPSSTTQDFPSSNEEHSAEKNVKAKKRKGSPLSNEVDQQQKDEKQKKNEQNQGVNSQKTAAKNSNEQSQNGGESSKEDYIHIRAKRGQATNSHSLAERVRREKISERMRLLQDLVPGCNKITGKAVMLDEIINYVQSLQRQVEFLSMKLAAVNPDLHLDIEQMISKDLHSREALGMIPGISTPHPQFHGPSLQGIIQPEVMFRGMPTSVDMLRTANTQIPPMGQMMAALWNPDFQQVASTCFNLNNSNEPTGSTKMEL